MDTTTKTNKIKNNGLYLCSFFIPLFILIIIYYLRDIYPFGEMCYLRTDMYHQYAPFFAEFIHKLKNGESLTYTFNGGLGINFTALYAYYLASPINFIAVLFPEDNVIEVMNAIIILKISASCLSFSYYISKHFNTKSIAVAGISLFYGLSAYIAAYAWNLMWLDCIILVPLIMLGIERLIKEKSCIMYCVCLGICIFSNYYISIMVCITCVIYFIAVLYMERRNLTFKDFKKAVVNFAIYSLLAGGMAACLLLPEIYALGLTVSSDTTFPDTWTSYYSVFEMIIRQLINVEVSTGLDHLPNIYCGVFVFLLIPLYCMCSKIPFREKVTKITILIIFLLSFNLNVLNYIWHGMHYPNSLPCRQSFIYIFFVLVMCYEAMRHIKSYSNQQIFGTFAGASAFILLLQKLYEENEMDFKIFYFSILFMAIYVIIMHLYRRDILQKYAIIALLIIFTATECSINIETTGFSTTNRTNYVSDNAAIETLLARLDEEDPDFYRIERATRKTKNDSDWLHYKSVSLFSSTANAGVTDFLGALGLEHSTNAYSFLGATPLSSSLLSVKYMIYNEYTENTDLMEIYDSEENRFLYENLYTLPVGFVVNSSLEDQWITEDSTPVDVQNSLAYLLTGDSDLLTPVYSDGYGQTATITSDEDQHLYAFVTSSTSEVTVSYSSNNTSVIKSDQTFNNLKRQYLLDLGQVSEGDVITISDEDGDTLTLNAYSFNEELFKEIYQELNESPLKVTNSTDNSIEGTIDVANAGTFFTSIPYDEGFSIYVDGKEVEFRAFKDAFICFDIESGEHTIEFKYTPVGFIPGIIISVVSIGILVIIIVFKKKEIALSSILKRKKVKEEQV